MIAVDIKRNGNKSEFVRVRPGVFGLRGLHAAGAKTEAAGAERDGRGDGTRDRKDETRAACTHAAVPHVPRGAPPAEGLARAPPQAGHRAFRRRSAELRGTPQNTVDWTDPDAWIPERLSGDDRDLATAIWTKSGKTVNPRHTYGHWLLSQKYEPHRGRPGR